MSNEPVDDDARKKVLGDPNLVSKINEWAVKYSLVCVEEIESPHENCMAQVVPIQVSKDVLEPNVEGTQVASLNGAVVGKPIPVRRVHVRSSWDTYNLVVAHDNGRIAVAETDESTGEHYVRYGIEDPAKEQKVTLTEPPHAIHVYGTAVYLGFKSTVCWIDFSSGNPECIQVSERVEMDMFGHKSYDLFARDGDLLVAVDDVILPYYADSFRLVGDNHAPMHKDGLMLPSQANGHYNLAAIAGDELLLGYAYGNPRFDGHGQMLSRVRFSELKRENGGWPEAVVVGESSYPDRDTTITTAPSLLNSKMTSWTGIVVHGDSIYLSAGARGLIQLSTRFEQAGPKARTIDLGKPVQSVCLAGEQEDTWATVGHEKPGLLGTITGQSPKYELVRFAPESGEILARVSLPGKCRLLN